MEPERAPTRWDTVLKRIATRACEGLVIWNTYRAVRLSSDVEDLFKLIDDNFLLGSSTAARPVGLQRPVVAADRGRTQSAGLG
jgi:hypothetical protein